MLYNKVGASSAFPSKYSKFEVKICGLEWKKKYFYLTETQFTTSGRTMVDEVAMETIAFKFK